MYDDTPGMSEHVLFYVYWSLLLTGDLIFRSIVLEGSQGCIVSNGDSTAVDLRSLERPV